MLNKRFRKWINSLFLGLFLSFIFSLISIPVCVNAASGSNFSDTYYYGAAVNSYRQLRSSGYSLYTYPQGTLCFKMNLWEEQYICIVCRRDMLVNNGSNLWGVYRSIANFDSSGNFLNGNNSVFFQMEGYSSDNFVTVDGVEYIIRSMTIADFIVDCPYFFAWSNRSEGSSMALKGYISGIKSFESGGDVSADIQVDLSGVEGSLADIASSNNAISDSNKSILDQLKTSIGSDSAFDIFAKDDLHVIRIIISCLFVVIVAQLFRNIFAQWLRNTIRR